jgi:hypothetical protein
MNGSGAISEALRLVTQLSTHTLNRWSDSLKDVDAVSADIFTNTVKAAKEVTKRMNKDFGENTTSFSKNLNFQNNSLKKSLTMKEFYVKNSQRKILKLTEDGLEQGRQGAIQGNAAAIADEEKVLEKRLKIFNATKLAIIDLTEEIEVQKKKEVASVETAALKDFASGQQEIRNKAKIQRDKDKIEAKRLSDIEKSKKDAEKVEQEDLKSSRDSFKIALQEELNAEKENLINKVITQEEYDLRVFEAEQAHLENMKNLNIAYSEDVAAINGQILDNELKMIADKAAAEKASSDAKIASNLKEQKDKEAAIEGMKEMGNQLILIAGEEEELQELKRIGIQLSQAAAVAAGFEAMAKYGAAIADTALNSPWWMKIINVVGLIGAMASTYSNMKALSKSFGNGGMIEEFANGGMVNGKSHAQGGEKFAVGGRVVELEGGEAVINKRSTSMFSSQLSAMNAAGGGVKFADGGLLNQPSFSQQQFNALGQNQMMGAMGGSSKVVVVEADITNSQNTVSVIQSQATI